MTAHEAAVQEYPGYTPITKSDKEIVQSFRDAFIKGWQAREKEGTIVWYSISEGHLPAISSKYNNRSEMVLVWGKDGWVQINYYNHEIGNWFSTDFPFVITHFAYINYPEPENSVKEQSS